MRLAVPSLLLCFFPRTVPGLLLLWKRALRAQAHVGRCHIRNGGKFLSHKFVWPLRSFMLFDSPTSCKKIVLFCPTFSLPCHLSPHSVLFPTVDPHSFPSFVHFQSSLDLLTDSIYARALPFWLGAMCTISPLSFLLFASLRMWMWFS